MQQLSEIFDAIPECLGAVRRTFSAGEHLFHEGEESKLFGIVIDGAVNIVRYSRDGRETVLAHLVPGEAFGTSFVLGGENRYFASIVAVAQTTVLLLRGDKVLNPCAQACPMHVKLLTRLVCVLAERNIALARKIECLTQRTTAEKLLAYLGMQGPAEVEFEIPFSRQQLADYLNVDRSALSTEIGKLVRAGRITAERSRFSVRGGGIS